MAKQHFILFHDHTSGMELHNRLKTVEVRTTIAPAPRSVSKCCGMSLLAKEQDLETIRRFIQSSGIEILGIVSIDSDYNIYRDKYC